MNDQKIIALIGKAIREGKYLSITYQNKSGDITPFWICILDINDKRELRANLFNVTKDDPIIDAKLYISRIQTAEILKFSHYDVSENLIKRLDEDEKLQIFEFDQYDNNVLDYFLECYKANKNPFLYKVHLIPGVDLTELVRENPYPLTKEQQKQLIKDIYHNEYHKFHDYELAISEFSIDLRSKGKFVVAYRKLELDPVNKTLFVGTKTAFNPNFYIKDLKHSLSYYTDISQKDFDGVIFQGRIPKVVFEINGIEHYKNKRRIASDKIKMKLLNTKGIARIAIPNQYVKHYEFIRELMNKIKGGAYQKTLFESQDAFT
jgi:hypothetical protein